VNAKEALQLARSEVESATQCADDHTKYHLNGVPALLNQVESIFTVLSDELVERRIEVEAMAEALRLHKDEILRLGGTL
jgi:hypothetical protein